MQDKKNTAGLSQQAGAPKKPTVDPEHTKEAHEQADADIDQDPDFMPGNEADDLDEAESVRLNDDENSLV